MTAAVGRIAASAPMSVLVDLVGGPAYEIRFTVSPRLCCSIQAGGMDRCWRGSPQLPPCSGSPKMSAGDSSRENTSANLGCTSSLDVAPSNLPSPRRMRPFTVWDARATPRCARLACEFDRLRSHIISSEFRQAPCSCDRTALGCRDDLILEFEPERDRHSRRSHAA